MSVDSRDKDISTQPENSDEKAVAPEESLQPAEETPDSPSVASPEVQWKASEYVYHEKSVAWFGILVAVTIVGAGLALFFQQWTFAALIVVAGVTLGVFANRRPHEVNYRIDSHGITVDQKRFPFSKFRAFGVLNEGAFYSIQLRPVQRFMPGVSIIFAESEGEKIYDSLAAHLPVEDIHPDPLDKFQRWLRF